MAGAIVIPNSVDTAHSSIFFCACMAMAKIIVLAILCCIVLYHHYNFYPIDILCLWSVYID